MQRERTVLTICLLVIAGTFILPYAIRSIRENALAHRSAPQRRPFVPSANRGVAPVLPAPVAIAADPILSPAAVLGFWSGNAVLEGRGYCMLQLELHGKDVSQIAGYFTLSCDYGVLFGNARTDPAHSAIGRMDPETAVLTGTPETGFYRFTVDRVLNPDVNGCGPSSFTATPFGNNRLAAEWQEPTCKGGHIILVRAHS